MAVVRGVAGVRCLQFSRETMDLSVAVGKLGRAVGVLGARVRRVS